MKETFPLAALVALLGCGTTAPPAPASSEPASTAQPTSSAGEAPWEGVPEAPAFVVASVGGLEEGDVVTVHVRRTREPSSFTVSGPFTETVTVEATAQAGGVNGAMLVAALAPLAGDDTITQYRLRTPRIGQAEPLATATVDFEDDTVSRFSDFMATDEQGTHHAFVDLHLEPSPEP